MRASFSVMLILRRGRRAWRRCVDTGSGRNTRYSSNSRIRFKCSNITRGDTLASLPRISVKRNWYRLHFIFLQLLSMQITIYLLWPVCKLFKWLAKSKSLNIYSIFKSIQTPVYIHIYTYLDIFLPLYVPSINTPMKIYTSLYLCLAIYTHQSIHIYI